MFHCARFCYSVIHDFVYVVLRVSCHSMYGHVVLYHMSSLYVVV